MQAGPPRPGEGLAADAKRRVNETGDGVPVTGPNDLPGPREPDANDSERAYEGRSVRRVLKQRVQVRFETPSSSGTGRLKNVSREGLFVATEAPPAPGDPAHVVFQDLADRWIELDGAVSWTRDESESSATAPPGFGMKIASPSDTYLEFFKELLKRPAAP